MHNRRTYDAIVGGELAAELRIIQLDVRESETKSATRAQETRHSILRGTAGCVLISCSLVFSIFFVKAK